MNAFDTNVKSILCPFQDDIFFIYLFKQIYPRLKFLAAKRPQNGGVMHQRNEFFDPLAIE